jgi:hypothetical protein
MTSESNRTSAMNTPKV